jgi:hypothetical protein
MGLYSLKNAYLFSAAYPGILFRGEGFPTNSDEDRRHENGDLGAVTP